MNKFVTKLVITLVLSMLPSVVSAQWTPIGSPNNTPNIDYWDHKSSDGFACNVGYVLTGVATHANCSNERPTSGWLPFTGPSKFTSLDEFKTTPGFNLFTVPVNITVYGDIAGQNKNWGWFTTKTVSGRTNLNGTTANSTQYTGLIGTSAPWGLWIQRTDGTYVYSDDQTSSGQFAFFRHLNNNAELFGGIEDVNLPNSDRDYNDVVFRLTARDGNISTVPEPSTYLMMATGLVCIGMSARRRKSAVKS